MKCTMKCNESIFSINDLAIYLKISKSTLYKLAQEGKLPGKKVGKHWRFKKNAVDRWLENEELVTSSTGKKIK